MVETLKTYFARFFNILTIPRMRKTTPVLMPTVLNLNATIKAIPTEKNAIPAPAFLFINFPLSPIENVSSLTIAVLLLRAR